MSRSEHTGWHSKNNNSQAQNILEIQQNVSYYQFMSTRSIADKITCLIESNKKLLLWTFLIGIFAFGYECCNFTFSINEEDAWLLRPDYARQAHAPNSRWAMLVYEYILPGVQYPFISCVLAILFLAIGYSIYAASWRKAGLTGQLIFGALAISSPVWAHMQEFSFMSAYVACSMMLTIWGALTAENSESTLHNFVLPIFALSFALLTYQSLIVLFYAPFCVNNIITGITRERIKLSFRLLGIGLISFVIYLLINKLLFSITGILKEDYLYNIIGWGKFGIKEIISRIYFSIKYMFSGVFVTYEHYYLLSIPVAIIYIKKRLDGFVSVTLSFLILFLLFISLFVLLGNRLNNRTLLYIPFIFSGIFFSAFYLSGKYMRYIIIALSIFVTISNASMNTRLFMLDTMARERDSYITMRFLNELYDVAPYYMRNTTGIIFMGGIKEDPTIPAVKLYDMEGFGYSCWSQKYGNDPWILYGFLKAYGIPLPPLAKDDKIKPHMDQIEAMPYYPAKGFVKVIDNIIVVRLSKEKP